MPTASHSNSKTLLRELAAERILVLDGAMGTMIQALKLDEEGYRGARFDAWNREVRGNNDLLNLTRPDVIREIHDAFLAAGADIVETNTFNANAISQSDYGLQEYCYEMNLAAARLALPRSRLVTDDVFHTASRRWLTQHAQAGGQWVAPALMPAEVVGAISRRTGKPELATRALRHLLQLPGLRLVALDRRLGKAAALLAAAAEGFPRRGVTVLISDLLADAAHASAREAAILPGWRNGPPRRRPRSYPGPSELDLVAEHGQREPLPHLLDGARRQAVQPERPIAHADQPAHLQPDRLHGAPHGTPAGHRALQPARLPRNGHADHL